MILTLPFNFIALQKFLIIQTAFIGDVILATGLIESIYAAFPDAQIDFLLRKGNESLLKGHPYISKIIIWDKKKNKITGLKEVIHETRKANYDYLINLQRFFSSGLISALSKATSKRGFDKNPLSFFYDRKIKHTIGNSHETKRNFETIADINNVMYHKPKLYTSLTDKLKSLNFEPQNFVCFAPASIWFTKQLPLQKWVELSDKTPASKNIYLLGAPGDKPLCDSIKTQSKHPNIKVLCGELSLLESAELMKHAAMNYVNDSAPMHLASSVNAPVTAFYCSTVPSFGFGPLSDVSVIKETSEKLDCRPCGLHGYRQCPKGHFKCGNTIDV